VILGRSSNHLACFKVNFDKNQELKNKSRHENNEEDFQTVSIENQEVLPKPISSPKEKTNKKYYSKINNHRIVRDSSPISRKSVDCLLEQHENNSNSSNDNNFENLEKETNIDNVETDENDNQYEHIIHKGSLASRLNSLRLKFNDQFKETRQSRSRLASNNHFTDHENLKSSTNKIKGTSSKSKILSSREIQEKIARDNKLYEFKVTETDRNVPNDTISDISTPNVSIQSNKKSDSFLKKLNETEFNNSNMLSQSFNVKDKSSKKINTNKSLNNLMADGGL